jgi:PAS domain S-box-containing protein
MGNGLNSGKLSSSLLEIQSELEDLRTRCISDPGNAEEVLSDALEQLQVVFEELSTANEELTQQNEELIVAQEALKCANDRLDLAQRAAGAGVWDWNVTTNRIEWSSELFDLFGLDPQKTAASFEAWNTIIHPEDKEIANIRIDQALKEHTGLNSEYRIVLPNGQIRWISALGQGIYDDQARPVRMIGICIDITKRKNVEEELCKSEVKYRTVADYTYDWELWQDPAGRWLYCSPSCERITGYSADEFLADPNLLRSIVYPDDLEIYDHHFYEGKCEEPYEHEVEFRIVHADGSVRWISHTCQSVFDDAGKYLGARGSNRDVTERKRMEDELARLASFPKLNPNPIAEVDLEGRVFFLNPAAQELLPNLQEMGKDHPWLADWGSVARMFCDSQTSTYVRDVSIGDNWYQQTMYFVPDIQRIRIYVQDITERKQAEIALQDAKEELEVSAEELRMQNDELMLAQSAILESENRLRTLGDNLPESAVYQYVHETAGSVRFLYISAGIERLNAVSVQDVLQDAGALHRQIPQEYYGQLVEAEARSARDLSDFDMELPMHRPDGQVRWMRLRSRPHRMQDGRIVWDGVQTDVTEHRTAEEALDRLSKQRQLALDAAHMGWWHYDPVTEISSWDDRYKEIFGVTGYQRPNEEILARLHPEDLPSVWAKVEAALDPANPQPYSAEYRINLPDGSMRWIEAHGIASFEGAGAARRATSLIGTVADITERKQAEEELRKSQNQFEVLIQNLSSGVALIDEHGRFTIVNPAFLRMFGLSDTSNIKNVNDQNWCEWQVFDGDGILLHVDDHPVRKAAMTGQPVRNKMVGVRLPAGGDLTWMLISAEPILKPDGRIDMVICTYHNITERKRAEKALQEAKEELEVSAEELRQQNEELSQAHAALRESRGKLQAALESMTDAVFISDTEGNFIDFNEAFATYHKFRSKEECYKTLSEYPNYIDVYFADGTLAPLDMWAVPRALRGETVTNAEYILRRKDTGETWWGSYSFGPIRDKNGTIVGSVVAGRDITDRKRQEKALRESEERFRLALRNAPVSVSAQDRDLRFTWAYNQRMARPEEIIGKFDADIFIPEDAEHLTAIKRRVLDENIEIREQMWLDRPGGRMFLDVCFEPIYDEAGRTIGVG